MSFVDASVIVAILNEEPGFEELEKRLNDTEGQLYVSPMVRFEAVAALSRLQITVSKGKVDRERVISEARGLVDEFILALQAKEVVIDARAGGAALEAMAHYGQVAGHPAGLNLGDCFAYASAKTYRLPLIYKGNDFSHTDLG